MRYSLFPYLAVIVILYACNGRHTGKDCLFDMGSGQRPVTPGYARVTPATLYDPSIGFGWLHAPARAFDTLNGKLFTPLLQDGVWAKDSLVYRADMPDGEYFMTVILGIKDSVDLKMTIAVDHAFPPDTVATPRYRVPYHTLRRKITVQGGKAIVSIKGEGTPVAMYGLELRPAGRNRNIDFATTLGEDTAAVKRALQDMDSTSRQADMMRKYLLACYYFDGGGWSWATTATGLSLMYRMNAAADLLEQVTADPDDPLYNRALYLLARIYYWLDQEDDNAWQQAKARTLFTQLHHTYPQDSIIRMYLGEKVPDACNMDTARGNAPLWAVYQREAMGRILKVIHWWVTEKQAANGELGGKYGDDVEILRWWLPAILGADDSLAGVGYRRLADGVWNSGQLERGFSKRIDDVEHAAELFRDTHPAMLMIRYGDPEYVERCLVSMQNLPEVWTGINALGHRHFRSYYLSATAVLSTPPYDVDVAMNARALLPGLWAAWYNGNPAILQLLGEWGRAWVADADRTANGKPAGVLPSAVSFANDQPGGHSTRWYAPGLTYDYYNWDHIGHVNELQALLAGMYGLTGKDIFLKPLNFYAALMKKAALKGAAAPGSLEWVQQQLLTGGSDHPAGVNPMGKLFAMAKQLTGSNRYDTLISLYGLHYNQYALSGHDEVLVQGLEELLQALRYNFPLLTSEVKFTDRVYLPNNSLLSGMYLGHSGAGYEYPGLLVSWKNTGTDVAVLVRGGDQRSLQADLYNAGNERTVIMRTWQLEPGVYYLKTGTRADTVTLTERVNQLPLRLPGHQLVTVSLTQLRAGRERSPVKADLALSERDITVEKRDNIYAVQAVIHNIGNRTAERCKVMFYADGIPKDSATVPLLDAPNDLQPRSKPVSFRWEAAPGTHMLTVSIVADQPEITKLNNTVAIKYDVQ